MKRQRDSSNEDASSGSEYDVSKRDKLERDDSLLSDIKSRLENSLSYLPRAMSFASSGSCPIEVNPAISISGLGGIGLPLSERDAKLVSEACHPAPYGKGTDTVVDPAVRKTRELDAKQFELRNPEWNKALQAIVGKAATELDVPGGAAGVKAVLYKMLLYGEGSMFKEHRDSEKEPGMFGTLVVCLPSKHEGGDVHVDHGGQKKTFRTAELSEFNYTYLCWYGDVKHEITEVTSGYRFVLTYNLINANPNNPAKVPTSLANKAKELEETLLFWKDNYKKKASRSPTVLIYLFEHLYTEQSLSYSGLKGGDRQRGECLLEACTKHGFLFYLAKLKLQIDGNCDDEDNDERAWQDLYWRARNNKEPDVHYITDITDECLELQRIVELDGTKLVENVPFSESQIVQDDPFGGDPDEEDFSGPTGNEGVSATHFYRRSVAVLMPIQHRIDFLFQSHRASRTDMGSWVNQLIDHYTSNKDDNSAKRDLVKACRLITREANRWLAENMGQPVYAHTPSPFYTDSLLGDIMDGGLRLGYQNICCEALQAVREQFPQPMTVQVIIRFGFDRVKKELTTAIHQFRHIHQSLQALIGIYDGYRRLEGEDSQILMDILTWMGTQTQNLLTQKRVSSKQDAKFAVEVGIRCGEDYFKQLASAFKIQIRTAKKQYKSTAITVLEFLIIMAEVWKGDQITLQTAQDVFRDVLQDFIPSIELVDPHCRGEQRKISDPYLLSASLDSEQVIQVLSQCVSLDLRPQIHQLFDKLERLTSDEEPATAFKGFFLPLAKELNEMAIAQSQGALAQEVQNMVRLFTQKLLVLYANRCVGPKPTPPPDWRRTKCGCGCVECLQLDSFLVDPVQEEFLFSASSKNHLHHLRNRLPLISLGFYERDKSEHETQIKHTASGFELSIRKTQLEWTFAVQRWEDDREAAEKVFGRVIDDEDMKKGLKKALENLGGEEVTESTM